MSKDINEIYDLVTIHITDQIQEGADPLAVSAAMIAVALSVYRTLLCDEEYNLMVDTISRSRDHVQPMRAKVTLQ